MDRRQSKSEGVRLTGQGDQSVRQRLLGFQRSEGETHVVARYWLSLGITSNDC